MSKSTKLEYNEPAAPAKVEAETILLDQVQSHGRRFLLNQPVEIEVTKSADGWCYESERLSILAFGRSRQEAFESFAEDFAVLWDEIAEAPMQSLAWDAIAVKLAFQQLVASVAEE